MDGHQLSQGWSPNIPGIVTQYSMEGPQSSQGWSPVTYHLEDGNQPPHGSIIPRMVTHIPLGGKPSSLGGLPNIPRIIY